MKVPCSQYFATTIQIYTYYVPYISYYWPNIYKIPFQKLVCVHVDGVQIWDYRDVRVEIDEKGTRDVTEVEWKSTVASEEEI